VNDVAVEISVTGRPTPEELAAVVAVLAAATSAAPAPEQPAPSGWGDPAARLRHPLPSGPRAWRTAR
jgi:hypothetical protein